MLPQSLLAETPKTSPQKTPFLTKHSNIPAFTAWDVNGRLEHVESMFFELKDKLSDTKMERERNGFEEVVALYKARSMPNSYQYHKTRLIWINKQLPNLKPSDPNFPPPIILCRQT